MTSEVSLTVLKSVKGCVYSFTKLIACNHEWMNPSKGFTLCSHQASVLTVALTKVVLYTVYLLVFGQSLNIPFEKFGLLTKVLESSIIGQIVTDKLNWFRWQKHC